jgi:hypothetical protein
MSAVPVAIGRLNQDPALPVLHTTTRVVRGQRKRKIRIAETRPWAQQLATCLLTALALPPSTHVDHFISPSSAEKYPDPGSRRPPETTTGP